MALGAGPQVLGVQPVTAVSPGGAQPGAHSQLLARPAPTASPTTLTEGTACGH